MSRQDRCPPRNATDLERRYRFRSSFREILGIAEDAQRAAEEANAEVAGLTAEQIFNILTDNGKEQGIYRKNGKIYINASYILTGELLASLLKTGVIKSKDGSVEIDLSQNKVTVYAADKSYWFEISAGEIKQYQKDENGTAYNTLAIDTGAFFSASRIGNPDGTGGISLYSTAGPTVVGAYNPPMGASAGETYVNGTNVNIGDGDHVGIMAKDIALFAIGDIKIAGKTVSWKDNGDGTFTLIGS
jgi:hypothetical protein